MTDNFGSSHEFDLLSSTHTHADLPATTDVLVIGGGLIGSSVAYFLSKSGVEVVLVEKGELNREASGTNAGSFHFQIAIHQLTEHETPEDRERLLAEVRLHIRAAQLWKDLEKELAADLSVHSTGGLMVAETESELRILFDKQKIEAQAGLETHVLVGKELRDFAPYLAEDLKGATYCPSEGHANPFVSGPIFALRAKEFGAAIRVHADVKDIQVLDDNPRYRFEVSTSRGSVKARRIVNAAGAWSKEIANLVGLDLPIYAGGLHVNVTEARDHMLVPLVQHIGRRLTLKQTYNGTFIIGGGWPARNEVSPRRYSNYWASAAGNTEVAVRVLPMLNDVRLLRTWTGLNTFMNDLTPIVGESARVPGYHVCLASTGFTLGPMIAVMLAEAMTSNKMDSLPIEYSPDR